MSLAKLPNIGVAASAGGLEMFDELPNARRCCIGNEGHASRTDSCAAQINGDFRNSSSSTSRYHVWHVADMLRAFPPLQVESHTGRGFHLSTGCLETRRESRKHHHWNGLSTTVVLPSVIRCTLEWQLVVTLLTLYNHLHEVNMTISRTTSIRVSITARACQTAYHILSLQLSMPLPQSTGILDIYPSNTDTIIMCFPSSPQPKCPRTLPRPFTLSTPCCLSTELEHRRARQNKLT